MPRSISSIATALRAAWLAALLAAGGCALLGRGEIPVDRSQDARIRQEVEQRLAREPSLDAAAIRVQVDGAVVQLHGSARGLAAWQCAAATTELVEGVRTVVNALAIEPGPREVTCLAARPVPAAPTSGA